MDDEDVREIKELMKAILDRLDNMNSNIEMIMLDTGRIGEN